MTVKLSSKHLKARRKRGRAIPNDNNVFFSDEYASNPSVPLEERIKNIVIRLQSQYQNKQVPVHVIRGFTSDATRMQFDEALLSLAKKGKLDFHVDNSKSREQGIYVSDVGNVFYVSEASVKAEPEPVSKRPIPAPVPKPVEASKPPKPAQKPVARTAATPVAETREAAPEPATKPEQAIVVRPVEAIPAPAELVPALASRAVPIDQNPVEVYLAKLSPGSRRTMREALTTIAALMNSTPEAFPWAKLRFQHTQAIRSKLAAKYSPATANKMLSALKGVLHQAYRLGQISGEDYQKARDVDGVRGTRVMRGRMLTVPELRTIFASIDKSTPRGQRDAAILGVMLSGGLRRAEVVAIDFENIDMVVGSIKILGKGNKQRVMYMDAQVKAALETWLRARGTEPGPLFVAISKTERVLPRRLTEEAIYFLLKQIQVETKLKSLSPHDLRRTTISQMLARGVDVFTVQKYVGHASSITTGRYDMRGEDAKREAVQKLDIPIGEF